MEVAKSLGLGIFRIVEEQGLWDGEFPTCIAPNPEYDQVFAIALEKYADADTDIIIATDPDSDRMGVMARDAAAASGGFGQPDRTFDVRLCLLLPPAAAGGPQAAFAGYDRVQELCLFADSRGYRPRLRRQHP